MKSISKLFMVLIALCSISVLAVSCKDNDSSDGDSSGGSSGGSSKQTIVNDTVSISALGYGYTRFTLNKTAKVSVDISCSGEKIYCYLMDAENFAKFAANQVFIYYSQLSREQVYSYTDSATIAAGTYYYVILNKNVVSPKTVTRKITVE